MAGSNLFTGTLDLLILQTLRAGPKHGYGIGKWLADVTGGEVELEESALYPALHRIEKRGLIEGEWGLTDTGRKARFYSLTPKGNRALERETSRWEAHAGAVFAVLRS
jgi:transcriptional regulator